MPLMSSSSSKLDLPSTSESKKPARWSRFSHRSCSSLIATWGTFPTPPRREMYICFKTSRQCSAYRSASTLSGSCSRMPSARMSAPEKSPTSNLSRTARMLILGEAAGLIDCARTPTSSSASPDVGPNEKGAPFGGLGSGASLERGESRRTGGSSVRSRTPVGVSPGNDGGGGIDGAAVSGPSGSRERGSSDEAAGGGTESARSSVSGSSKSKEGHDETEG